MIPFVALAAIRIAISGLLDSPMLGALVFGIGVGLALQHIGQSLW